jgi:hypothetical protein
MSLYKSEKEFGAKMHQWCKNSPAAQTEIEFSICQACGIRA